MFINTACRLLSLKPDLFGETSTFWNLADRTDEFARELYDLLESKKPPATLEKSKTNL